MPGCTSARTATAVADFTAYYRGETRHAYETDLSVFGRWLDERGVDILDVTRAQLEDYARWLVYERGNKLVTMKRRVSTLRRFYDLAADDGLIDRSPAARMRIPTRYESQDEEADLPWLDSHDLHRLLVHVQRHARVPAEAAAIHLMGTLGLRSGEVRALRVGDYRRHHNGHQVLEFHGKGGKFARIPLPIPLIRILDAAAGDRPDEALLIPRRNGTAHTRKSLALVVTRWAKAAGIDGPITPHGLRRSWTSAAFDAGATDRAVQVAGRWADGRHLVRYDRARNRIDRHAAYAVSAFLAG